MILQEMNYVHDENSIVVEMYSVIRRFESKWSIEQTNEFTSKGPWEPSFEPRKSCKNIVEDDILYLK